MCRADDMLWHLNVPQVFDMFALLGICRVARMTLEHEVMMSE